MYNDSMVRDELLAEARKFIPECDYIVDLFDLRFQWASEKVVQETGFSMEELLNMRNIDIVSDKYDEAQLRRELIERITKGQGEKEYIIKSKNKGDLLCDFAYHSFGFEGVWYMVGKIIKVSPVSQPA